jgi:hypothetical protein
MVLTEIGASSKHSAAFGGFMLFALAIGFFAAPL